MGRGLLLPPVGPVGPVGPVVRGLLLLTVGLRSTGVFAFVAQKLKDKTGASKPVNPLKHDWFLRAERLDADTELEAENVRKVYDRLKESYNWLKRRNEFVHSIAENTLLGGPCDESNRRYAVSPAGINEKFNHRQRRN